MNAPRLIAFALTLAGFVAPVSAQLVLHGKVDSNFMWPSIALGTPVRIALDIDPASGVGGAERSYVSTARLEVEGHAPVVIEPVRIVLMDGPVRFGLRGDSRFEPGGSLFLVSLYSQNADIPGSPTAFPDGIPMGSFFLAEASYREGDNAFRVGITSYTGVFESAVTSATPVPEPSAYGWAGVAVVLGLVALHRRARSRLTLVNGPN